MVCKMGTDMAKSGMMRCLALVTGTGLSLAVTGGQALAAGPSEPGLPQLDISTWPSQIFWLVVIFGVGYVMMAKVVTPKIGTVLEDRRTRLDGDLGKAREASAEAAKIRAEYEADLEAARNDAAAFARQAAAEAAEKAAAVEGKADKKLASKVASAEKKLAEAKAELTRITDLFPAQVLGDQYSSLMLLSGMHGQFFGDKKLRSAIEKLLFVTFQKLPTNLRLDAMAPLVEHYVENGDGDSGRDVILKMTNLMSQFSFRTEERLPQLARIAQLRNTCGDTGRAEVELVAALKDYHDHRDEVVNIYRCETLRPVALAWHALGNTSQADDLIALALEESLENPNSRPRCDDLVETCIALAEHQLKPSPELWQRMTEIGEGLSAPW